MSRDDELAEQVQQDFRASKLEQRHKALCEWAEKLTLTPAKCTREDIENLKAEGWSEEQIASAAQIIGYFNYVNRLLNGLGVSTDGDIVGYYADGEQH